MKTLGSILLHRNGANFFPAATNMDSVDAGIPAVEPLTPPGRRGGGGAGEDSDYCKGLKHPLAIITFNIQQAGCTQVNGSTWELGYIQSAHTRFKSPTVPEPDEI